MTQLSDRTWMVVYSIAVLCSHSRGSTFRHEARCERHAPLLRSASALFFP